MTKSPNANTKNDRKVRLCQLVASTHTVEQVLTVAQIATRLGKSTKTIRNWLRQATDAPKAFKDQNEWFVSISEYEKWEVRSQL
ncbi:helix-turn-helix domain-containing protein [Shewanella sp. 1CM18E]|uniref:helix-turn-helix domain-containing protein n=1 Tax=Shewanella sp. 1CM18E TaxID=2929169 RepID=UPI0020BE6640|nr:helix-turn-helix domain-containing protein [Shewanella sp. 1CM18E]MCK8047161.1 helix-turn-helix domain-containing protein [Shewanella sp. 1CM18E]